MTRFASIHLRRCAVALIALAIPGGAAAQDRTTLAEIAAGYPAAIAQYREIEANGGWNAVDEGATLGRGMRDDRVAQIKRRLAASGDYRGRGDTYVFDEPLVEALKSFQLRHGLPPSGYAGAETIAEMNVPVKARIAQLLRNVERSRSLPAGPGERYLYVNIADSQLTLVERGRVFHTTRIVAGEADFPTPVLSSVVTYLELNPYWNVPQSIARRIIIPHIKKEPDYLAKNKYLVLTRMGDHTSAVNPATVNWSAVTPANFRYTLRQRPGVRNVLGRVVFMFANKYNVFLHDTVNKDLFDEDERYYSSGCVRVESALYLALLLLRPQEEGSWTEQRLNAVLAENDEPVRVELKRPIPVHIRYLTAWMDAGGMVQFRKDAYRRDGL